MRNSLIAAAIATSLVAAPAAAVLTEPSIDAGPATQTALSRIDLPEIQAESAPAVERILVADKDDRDRRRNDGRRIWNTPSSDTSDDDRWDDDDDDDDSDDD